MESNNSFKIGTMRGFYCVSPNIVSEDILKVIILAVVGAIISFIISLLKVDKI
jgi:hypothetical protein